MAPFGPAGLVVRPRLGPPSWPCRCEALENRHLLSRVSTGRAHRGDRFRAQVDRPVRGKGSTRRREATRGF